MKKLRIETLTMKNLTLKNPIPEKPDFWNPYHLWTGPMKTLALVIMTPEAWSLTPLPILNHTHLKNMPHEKLYPSTHRQLYIWGKRRNE